MPGEGKIAARGWNCDAPTPVSRERVRTLRCGELATPAYDICAPDRASDRAWLPPHSRSSRAPHRQLNPASPTLHRASPGNATRGLWLSAPTFSSFPRCQHEHALEDAVPTEQHAGVTTDGGRRQSHHSTSRGSASDAGVACRIHCTTPPVSPFCVIQCVFETGAKACSELSQVIRGIFHSIYPYGTSVQV